jgi:hypothetical protein
MSLSDLITIPKTEELKELLQSHNLVDCLLNNWTLELAGDRKKLVGLVFFYYSQIHNSRSVGKINFEDIQTSMNMVPQYLKIFFHPDESASLDECLEYFESIKEKQNGEVFTSLLSHL